MDPSAVAFMLASWIFILGLTAWCLWKQFGGGKKTKT